MIGHESKHKNVITQGRTLDHVAGIYDLLSPLMTFGIEKRLSDLCVRQIAASGSLKILDIGCGTGTLTIALAKSLASEVDSFVVGVDAAPRMIDAAWRKTEKLTNIRFDVAAAEVLPYPDDSFHCAVSTFFFHHVNAALKRCSLDEIWRVLVPGGTLDVVDVDIPVTLFGKICAWSGYYLFRQEEIRENIYGCLREAFNLSQFLGYESMATYYGYITHFKLTKL